MAICGPMDVDKGQILFREQSTEGTAETLTAADGKIRLISGTTPEYNPDRNPRNVARGTQTPIGSLEGKKSLGINFSSEINTPDTFNIAATAAMAISSFAYQSAGVVRITFDDTEDLSAVVDGSYITVHYATDTTHNGTFLIIATNGTTTVDIINKLITSAANDETSSPAVGDIQTNLEYQGALNCCGLSVKGLMRQSLTTVNVSSFTHNETITQASSLATARVVVPCSHGDSHIYYELLTGVPVTTELWTGGTSLATTAPTAGPEVHGYFVKPRSNCQSVGTIEYQEDGFAWSARDAMGNLTGNIPASAQALFDFAFMGPRGTIGTKALTTGITRATEEPPVCKNADLTFDGTYEPVFSQFGFDLGQNVVLRQNGNAADDTGYEGARIAGTRQGKFTATVEMVLQADYDYYTKLDAGTKIAVQGKLGTAATKQVWFFFPYVELDEIPLGEADKIRTLEISGTLTGPETSSGDDEVEIAFIGN